MDCIRRRRTGCSDGFRRVRLLTGNLSAVVMGFTVSFLMLLSTPSAAFQARITAFQRWNPQRSPALMVAKTGGKEILSENQFTEDVLSAETERPIMVFFTAPWCGPCRLSVPVVKEVMKQFSEQIDVVEVCTDELPDVASDAGVVSIPTIQLYYKGNVLDTIIGCVAKNVLASSVTKALEDIVGVDGVGGKT